MFKILLMKKYFLKNFSTFIYLINFYVINLAFVTNIMINTIIENFVNHFTTLDRRPYIMNEQCIIYIALLSFKLYNILENDFSVRF